MCFALSRFVRQHNPTPLGAIRRYTRNLSGSSFSDRKVNGLVSFLAVKRVSLISRLVCQQSATLSVVTMLIFFVLFLFLFPTPCSTRDVKLCRGGEQEYRNGKQSMIESAMPQGLLADPRVHAAWALFFSKFVTAYKNLVSEPHCYRAYR